MDFTFSSYSTELHFLSLIFLFCCSDRSDMVLSKLVNYFVFPVFLVPNPKNPEEITRCGYVKCHFGDRSISMTVFRLNCKNLLVCIVLSQKLLDLVVKNLSLSRLYRATHTLYLIRYTLEPSFLWAQLRKMVGSVQLMS